VYVCLCNCVTDRQIVEAAAEFGAQSGYGDAAAFATQVVDGLGAGLGCGSCREFALDLAERAATRHMSVVLSDQGPASIELDTPSSGPCDLPFRLVVARNNGALSSQGE